MEYLLLFVGLGLLLLGANYLVESSVAIAQRARISNFIIGLTVVGIGTSAPELFVSIRSALEGSGDIAMGNVIGSNIANLLLILGVAAAIAPFALKGRDSVGLILATILVLLMANDTLLPHMDENVLSRFEGVVLLLLFMGYMGMEIYRGAKAPQQAEQEAGEQTASSLTGKNVALLWAVAVVSLAALIYGGTLFLDNAKLLAHAWGMSDAVISITIVAVGTSLPELVTAVIAALKHNPQLALGNVIGSCVFNLLMILGLSAVVEPLTLVSIHMTDYLVALAAAVATWAVVHTFKKDSFDRVEGFLFLAAYVAYTVYLLLRA